MTLSAPPRRALPAVWIALAITAVFGVLTFLHTSFVNGPAWWKWHWHEPGLLESVQALAILGIPLLLVLWATRPFGEAPRRYGRRLAVLAFAGILLQPCGLLLQRDLVVPGTLIGRIKSVHHGHFVAAERLMATGDDWLARFPELSPGLTIHPRVHPPGPATFHAILIRITGDTDTAALTAGVLLGLIAAMVAPTTFFLSRSLGFRRRPSLAAAALATLMPALILFFPSFDTAYAPWITLMAACWAWGLRQDHVRFAVLFGLMLAVASFMQYRLLVIGTLVVGIMALRCAFPPHRSLAALAKHAAVALTSVFLSYLALWWFTGFRPDLAFAQAYRNELENLSIMDRHLPRTIPWALWDYALGMGWLPAMLALLALVHRLLAARPGIGRRRQETWVLVVLLLQPVIVACSGFIQAETARCWTFLMPLMAVAAGSVLARCSRREQVAVYAMMAVTIATVGLNLWLR